MVDLIDKFNEATCELDSQGTADPVVREVSFCFAANGGVKDFTLSPQRLENLELLIEKQLEAKLSSVKNVNFRIARVCGAADAFYSELEWLTTWSYHFNYALYACDSRVNELDITATPSGFFVCASRVKCRRNIADIKLRLKKLFQGFSYSLKIGKETLQFEADLSKGTINKLIAAKTNIRARELLVNV